ncbi:MAG TPA: hypothetical protein VIT19_11625 [Pyrinomonadaceae bacterium]
MSSNSDQAKRIAERVARKLADSSSSAGVQNPSANSGNGVASDQPRARIIDFISSGPPVRSKSSVVAPSTPVEQPPQNSSKTSSEFFQFIPATQSPWLGRLPAMLGQDVAQSANLSAASPGGQPGWGASPPTVDHPSQERFGIEEATVAELVEFFEKEKKCSVDPSGKPCDHCAMCNSRGF